MIEKMKEGQLDRVMDIWLQTNILAHPFIPREHWKNLFDTVKDILPSADIFIYRDKDEIKGFIGITDNQYIAGLEGAVEFHKKNQFVISGSKRNPDFNHEKYRMGWSAGQP